MAQGKAIAAADAVKLFGKSDIKVRVAKRITVRDKDTKKEREGFDVKETALAAEHILAAADFGDRVGIVTIDGRKYEAKK